MSVLKGCLLGHILRSFCKLVSSSVESWTLPSPCAEAENDNILLQLLCLYFSVQPRKLPAAHLLDTFRSLALAFSHLPSLPHMKSGSLHELWSLPSIHSACHQDNQFLLSFFLFAVFLFLVLLKF